MLAEQLIPELNTTYTESLHFLETYFCAKRNIIADWFKNQWDLTPPPVYGSVDLRNAGFKIAPIDMNLFPAGFNNLNPEFLSTTVLAAKKAITRFAPYAKRILIIPESHTRNIFYWENIFTLKKILERAGFEPRFAMMSDEVINAKDILLPSGNKVTVEPLLRKNNKLYITNFCPDLILLNNDLSEGIPEILQNLDHPLIPPAELGWSQRLKSEHFQYYEQVVREFSNCLSIDPWLIAPLFRHCGKIDFMQQEGLECLITNAEILFEEIQKKYNEYKIPYQPFLVVKADAGTYGMAVMTVRDVDELKNMNRKQRTQMSMTKGKQPVRKVIIQEGVYTFETFGSTQSVAEPVVYLWGDCVVGGFYRVHKDKRIDESLNAPGMHFEQLPFTETCTTPCDSDGLVKSKNRFYVYGVVAQLSMLAAAREIKDQASK